MACFWQEEVNGNCNCPRKSCLEPEDCAPGLEGYDYTADEGTYGEWLVMIDAMVF